VTTRGQLFWVDFGAPMGSEPGFRRPAVVIQGDRFNRSNIATCVVAILTSKTANAEAPGNVFVPASVSGLARDSVVNITQLITVDKGRLDEPIGTLPGYLLAEVSAGLRLVLDL
jgi:mRNA interferase MazF